MASPVAVRDLEESVATLRRDIFDAVSDLHVRIDVIHSLASRAHQISLRLAASVEHLEFRLRVLKQIADTTDLMDPPFADAGLNSLD